jgi:hypothetical protein
LCIPAISDEARLFQDGHVAGHSRLARAQLCHQLADTMFAPIPKNSEGSEAGWFGKRREDRNDILHADTYIAITAYAQ